MVQIIVSDLISIQSTETGTANTPIRTHFPISLTKSSVLQHCVSSARMCVCVLVVWAEWGHEVQVGGSQEWRRRPLGTHSYHSPNHVLTVLSSPRPSISVYCYPRRLVCGGYSMCALPLVLYWISLGVYIILYMYRTKVYSYQGVLVSDSSFPDCLM